MLSDTNLESPVYISVFPDYELKAVPEKTLIKNNFYKLHKVLRANPQISALISAYLISAPTSYGGVRIEIGPGRQSLEEFKTKLNTF